MVVLEYIYDNGLNALKLFNEIDCNGVPMELEVAIGYLKCEQQDDVLRCILHHVIRSKGVALGPVATVASRYLATWFRERRWWAEALDAVVLETNLAINGDSILHFSSHKPVRWGKETAATMHSHAGFAMSRVAEILECIGRFKDVGPGSNE